MKRLLTHFLPNSLKPFLKKIYYSILKCYYIILEPYDRYRGRDSMIPPRSMIFIGNGDFRSTGQEFKRYFIDLAKIKPNYRVLDVGCGIGRMAIPLTEYLSSEGEYWGFDIVKTGVEWCQERISSKFKNFHFQHIDVTNKTYNTNGIISAKDFRFPYEKESFDFVFLTSVFTHMFPADMEHYLSEVSRVLKKGGKCFITYFLLNEESMQLVQAGQSTLDFKYNLEGCRTVDLNNPEDALAFNEDYVRQLFGDSALKILEPIHYGSWCKRKNFLSFQDIIIATKENS